MQEQLEAKEDWLSVLELTQKTMNTILGEASQAVEPEPGSEKSLADTSRADPEAEAIRRGVMLVPPWEPSLALRRGEAAAKVEGLRGKLKRLTERG
ncbi:hypothetical protein ACSNOI_07325 [Actinomadura kijaniata]|uniref:hypothetical protein n=1 Tax=Actinomadura kijaniata TaxID=46161 RepID=UPI003F1B20AC